MCRHHSSELPGASGFKRLCMYQDYPLGSSLELVLSMCFIGILMGYGPPAWLAYGFAGLGGLMFLMRVVHLIRHPEDVSGPPRWGVLSKLLALAPYAFLFFIKDLFGLMWLILAVMILLVVVKLWTEMKAD